MYGSRFKRIRKGEAGRLDGIDTATRARRVGGLTLCFFLSFFPGSFYREREREFIYCIRSGKLQSFYLAAPTNGERPIIK